MIRQTWTFHDSTPTSAVSLPRNKRESNLAWLQRAFDDLALDKPAQWSFILLAGGKDIVAFRIRVAQSHLRKDMLPSLWSDCALLAIAGSHPSESDWVYHVPLLQPVHAEYAPARNGIVSAPLKSWLSQQPCPNLALIAVPVAQTAILQSIAHMQDARATFDAIESILPWLAFVWGAGNTGNPLLQSVGLPSALMLDALFGREGFDLAPSVNSALSTPEAFWGGIKYWQSFYEKASDSKQGSKARFVIDHEYAIS